MLRKPRIGGQPISGSISTRMRPHPCGYRCDVSLVSDIALSIGSAPGRQHSAIETQTNGVRHTGVRGGVHIAGRDSDYAVPTTDIALTGPTIAGGDHSAVLPHRHRASSGGRKHWITRPKYSLHTSKIEPRHDCSPRNEPTKPARLGRRCRRPSPPARYLASWPRPRPPLAPWAKVARAIHERIPADRRAAA